MRSYLVILLCVYTVRLSSSTDAPQVQTKLGKYKGHYKTTYSGRQVAAFNGIRYAKPPINNLRFKEPEKIEPHDGLYDATNDGDDCLQENKNYNKYVETEGMKYVGNEDCLFLNVYTPNVNPDKPYPVIVYIHGGYFMIGTGASNQHGPEFLLDKDVVLVSLNYRLGVFGFLSLDEEILAGNLGLKDQSLAIHWVKDNIASFGGDPDSIVLVGHSAGAASAQFQMISPLNKGIIKRAIAQSGSGDISSSSVPIEEARDFATKLSVALNCPQSPQPLLACLQEKTWNKIMDSVLALLKERPMKLVSLGPVFETKDGGFMTRKDYAQGSSIPMMTGVTKDEGLILYKNWYSMGNEFLKDFYSNYKIHFPEIFYYSNKPRAEKITDLIKQNYFRNQDISSNNTQQLINMISDGTIIHGTLTSARNHKGKTYFYLITHKGQNSLASGMPISGVCHADELFYLFPFSKASRKLQFNDEDSKVQKLIVDLWTNFVIHGDPTPGNAEPKWYESENGKLYVTISAEGIRLSKDFYSTRMNFWDNLYKNFFNNYSRNKDEL